MAVVEAPSKRVAHELALAIDARCLTYQHYIPWADGLIERLEHPPSWICQLSITEHHPDALRVIREFAYSEPFEQFDGSAEVYIGFLWIRCGRGELSWATFLEKAGNYTDGGGADIGCEYFYSMLNKLEEAKFSTEVEDNQRKVVRLRLIEAILKANEFCAHFETRN